MKKKIKIATWVIFVTELISFIFALVILSSITYFNINFEELSFEGKIVFGILIIGSWLWLASFLSNISLYFEYKLREYTED